jgi:hypothetical protein
MKFRHQSKNISVVQKQGLLTTLTTTFRHRWLGSEVGKDVGEITIL